MQGLPEPGSTESLQGGRERRKLTFTILILPYSKHLFPLLNLSLRSQNDVSEQEVSVDLELSCEQNKDGNTCRDDTCHVPHGSASSVSPSH